MAMRSYKRMRMQMLITRHDREWQPDGEPLTDAERREMQKIIPGSAAKHERRSEEHTSELQSLMRISYAVSCLKKTKHNLYYTSKYNTTSIPTHPNLSINVYISISYILYTINL